MEQLEKAMQPTKKFTFVSSIPNVYKSVEYNTLRAKRSKEEDLLYNEVIENVTRDLEELGIKANYSVSILINELAWNLVIFSRLKHYLNIKDLLRYEGEYKLIEVHKTSEAYTDRKTDSKFYDIISQKDRIHPLYNEFLFKLEKSINKLLELLGLLPQQQLERKKVLFVEKLKQRLISIENGSSKYTIEAVESNKL